MNHYFQRNQSLLAIPEETSGSPGFRRCQLGALWAVRSHFTVSDVPALLSLPTGSGKTAVMIALAFALAARRVFVLTPSALIRRQTRNKFRSLRLLRSIHALPEGLEAPEVLEVTTERQSEEDWRELLKHDVVIAHPATVSPRSGAEDGGVVPPPPEVFGSGSGEGGQVSPGFDLVFIDEAHHSPAKTWNNFLKLIHGARVVCLTATPFRRDRKRIRARLIYNYPIPRAVEDGIYRTVRFIPVEDPDPVRRDYLLAEKALDVFKEERRKNPEAAVIIKAKTIRHATELDEVYRSVGWRDLGIIHSKRPPNVNANVVDRVHTRRRKEKRLEPLAGFISVAMGGEGLDIPNLKMAVFHETPQTLPYTVQLIGRVSRVEDGQADEAILIADPGVAKGSEVQSLYSSDDGWKQMLPQLFQEYLREGRFYPEAGSHLADLAWLAADDLQPYLSVRLYHGWVPPMPDATPFTDPRELDDSEIELEVYDRRENMAVAITARWEVPRWTTNRALETAHYDLHVFYAVDSLLFESTTSERICQAIRGKIVKEDRYDRAGHYLIRRCLSDASGSNYHMVGLKNQSGISGAIPQYKTYLGAGVQAALRRADGRAFGAGHAMMSKNGETRGIAVGSSRIWSTGRRDLDQFRAWCDRLAELISQSADGPIPHVEDKLMVPRPVDEYPEGAEPVAILFDDVYWRSVGVEVYIDGEPMADDPLCRFTDWRLDRENGTATTTLEVRDPATSELVRELPLEHRLGGRPFWKLLSDERVDIVIDPGPAERDYSGPLERFLQDFPPLIVLSNGATLRNNVLFEPKIQSQRLDRELVEAKSWKDTDLKKEARSPEDEYKLNVLQRTIEIIREELNLGTEDLLVTDDRANEVADLVLIRWSLRKVIFFHCKYKVSAGRKPGASRHDVSELADQGVRTGHWIWAGNLLDRLSERVKGLSKMVHGRARKLRSLAKAFYPDQWRYEVVLVQPGLSRAKLLDQPSPSQAEQLLLMLYDRITADYGAAFKVWTSD